MNELGVLELGIFTPGIPCNNPPICREETLNNITYVTTHLTITNPIDYVVNASISCASSPRVVSWYGYPKSKQTRKNLIENENL